MHARSLLVLGGIVALFFLAACGDSMPSPARPPSPLGLLGPPEEMVVRPANGELAASAKAAYEAWVKTSDGAYRDPWFGVEGDYGSYTKVQVIAWFQPTAGAPWEQRAASISCQPSGETWQCPQQFAFAITSWEASRQGDGPRL